MSTAATMRLDRPDGTSTETVWHTSGRTVVTHTGPDRALTARMEIEPRRDGTVAVWRYGPTGRSGLVTATPLESRANPYGSTVERFDHDGVVVVENAFDAEGNLRTVTLEGPWGRQELELRPDGARSRAWHNLLHTGRAEWDAGGSMVSVEVIYVDGTEYRWEGQGGSGRRTMVAVGGTVSVDDQVHPPELGD